MNRKEIISKLKEHVLLHDGHRNDDAVNLAIVAYNDKNGEIKNSLELYRSIARLIIDEKMDTDELTDLDYLGEKCEVLMGYLPDWYNTGDIYGYAIN